MAEQFYVDLATEPVVDTSTFAIWVLDKAQINNLLATGFAKKWYQARTSKRVARADAYHPSARARRAVPAPMARFLGGIDDTRNHPGKVLYHGYGRDTFGLAALSRKGRDKVVGYDPYHPKEERRKLPSEKFDEVFSIYTLNVVDVQVGRSILEEIVSCLKEDGRAIIAVRRDL